MQLVDIGLNLSHHRFDKDRAAVLARAQSAGVVQAVFTGSSLDDSRAALELADGSWAMATVGVHPHNAADLGAGDPASQATLASIEALTASPRCVAIGECGLDFERGFASHSDQESALEAQLDLATRLQKPVFLHQRAAWPRLAEILTAYIHRLPGAVVHCFTEGPETARAALDLGCHIGVTGWICDDRRAAALRAALAIIPVDRLMLETDAPYLTPRDLRRDSDGHSPVQGMSLSRLKSRNEPALLPWVCRAVAHHGGHDAAKLATATTATARRFFHLPQPGTHQPGPQAVKT